MGKFGDKYFLNREKENEMNDDNSYAQVDTPPEFSDWLIREMNTRDWTQADLARASGLSRQAISNYISGRVAKPDENALKEIARALGYPPETVFRIAKILPESQKHDETVQRIIHLINQLDEYDKLDILVFVESRFELKKRKDAIADLQSRLDAIPSERTDEILELFDRWMKENGLVRRP